MKEKTPRTLIQEIIFKKAAMREAQDIIDNETSRYQKAIEKPKTTIESCKKGIQILKETKVAVNLEKLVNEIAKEWGVPVEDLKVEFEFDSIATYEKHTFESLKNWYLAPKMFSEQPHQIELTVSSKKNKINTIISLTNDLTEEFFKQPQKDGRTFEECLRLEVKENDNTAEYKFVCDDYKNIIFNFEIGDLIERDGCLTDAGDIIVKATESNDEKENNF